MANESGKGEDRMWKKESWGRMLGGVLGGKGENVKGG